MLYPHYRERFGLNTRLETALHCRATARVTMHSFRAHVGACMYHNENRPTKACLKQSPSSMCLAAQEWNTRAEEKKEEYLEACRAYEAKTSHQPTLTLSQPATTDSPTKESHDSTSEAPDVDAPMADVEPTEEAPADDGAAPVEEASADGAATESTPAGDETDAETQPMDTATEESAGSAHTD